MSTSQEQATNFGNKKSKGKEANIVAGEEQRETGSSVQEITSSKKHKKSKKRRSEYEKEANLATEASSLLMKQATLGDSQIADWSTKIPDQEDKGETKSPKKKFKKRNSGAIAEDVGWKTGSPLKEVSPSKKLKKSKKGKSNITVDVEQDETNSSVKESPSKPSAKQNTTMEDSERADWSSTKIPDQEDKGETKSHKKKSKKRNSGAVAEDEGWKTVTPLEEVSPSKKHKKSKKRKSNISVDIEPDETNSSVKENSKQEIPSKAKDTENEHSKKQNTTESSGQDGQSEIKSLKKKSKKKKKKSVVFAGEQQEADSSLKEIFSQKHQGASKDKQTFDQNGTEMFGGEEEARTKSSKKKSKKRKHDIIAESEQRGTESSLREISLHKKQKITEARQATHQNQIEAPGSKVKDEKKRPKKNKKKQKESPALRPTTPTGSNKTLATEYLRSWKKSKSPGGAQWRFQKVRQVWLLHNMLDSDEMSSEDFAIMLEYLKGIQGKARQLTIEKMESLIQELDAEMQTIDEAGVEKPSLKEMKTKWKRASSVLQTLT